MTAAANAADITTHSPLSQNRTSTNITLHDVTSTNEMVFSKKRSVRKSIPAGAQYRPRNATTSTVAAAALVTYTRSEAKDRSS